MNTHQFATKQDVRDIVGEVVGELLSDALTHIDICCNKIEHRLARIEKKLDATTNWVGEHEVRLRQLELKPA